MAPSCKVNLMSMLKTPDRNMKYRILVAVIINMFHSLTFADAVVKPWTPTSDYDEQQVGGNVQLKVINTNVTATVSVRKNTSVNMHTPNIYLGSVSTSVKNTGTFVSACVKYKDFTLENRDARRIPLSLQYRENTLKSESDVVCDTETEGIGKNDIGVYVPGGINAGGVYTLRVAVWIYAQ